MAHVSLMHTEFVQNTQASYPCRGCVRDEYWNVGGEEDYHCETFQFDAHRDCAERRDTANVFFHSRPLTLEDQNYFMEKPGAMCGFCEESMKGSA